MHAPVAGSITKVEAHAHKEELFAATVAADVTAYGPRAKLLQDRHADDIPVVFW